MIKCLIKWDAGCGEEYKVIHITSLEEAEKIAYTYWREAVESQADYGALELTEDVINEYGLDEEELEE